MSTQLTTTQPFSPSCRNVLIIGGGPTGLAAALMLAKRGWTEITVLEKRVAANYYEPDKSFNYLIDGRGQKFTDLLGLTEQLSAIGVSSTEFHLTRIQPNGSRKTIKVPLIDPSRKPAYWVQRQAFVQLLYQEIQQHWSNQITVVFDTNCTTIHKVEHHGSETLEVIAEKKDSAQQLRFEPRLLMGCDGIQSIVRSTLNVWDDSGKFEVQHFPSPSSGLKYKVLSLPPSFPLDPQGTELSVSTMSYAIRGTFQDRNRAMSLGLLPIKNPEVPRTANVVTRPNHQLWQLTTREAILPFLEHAFPQLPLDQIISPEEAERFASSVGGAFPIPQFCTGLHVFLPASGVLLLGDAIHSFPPDIGQGVNSALEDVVVLNQVLAEEEDDLSRALPRYEAVRSPDVDAVVRLAQVAAPWQYNQDPLRAKLWAIAFAIRLGLSKVLPFIHPPAFFLLQDHKMSYQEVWRKHQSTERLLTGITWISFAGLLGFLVLRTGHNL
jgi:kynurenine 3-monooxygenase